MAQFMGGNPEPNIVIHMDGKVIKGSVLEMRMERDFRVSVVGSKPQPDPPRYVIEMISHNDDEPYDPNKPLDSYLETAYGRFDF